MNINGLNIDFHVAPQNFCLPFDGVFCLPFVASINRLSKIEWKDSSDPYLLPNITEIFDKLGKTKFYHVIDLKSGFHQIPMKTSDIHKTAFSINPWGRFEFRVLPFGLRNTPRTFQRVLNTVLGDLIGKICFVFIDDIIIFDETVTEANERFNTVAQKLRETNLTLEPEKCEFLYIYI